VFESSEIDHETRSISSLSSLFTPLTPPTNEPFFRSNQSTQIASCDHQKEEEEKRSSCDSQNSQLSDRNLSSQLTNNSQITIEEVGGDEMDNHGKMEEEEEEELEEELEEEEEEEEEDWTMERIMEAQWKLGGCRMSRGGVLPTTVPFHTHTMTPYHASLPPTSFGTQEWRIPKSIQVFVMLSI